MDLTTVILLVVSNLIFILCWLYLNYQASKRLKIIKELEESYRKILEIITEVEKNMRENIEK